MSSLASMVRGPASRSASLIVRRLDAPDAISARAAMSIQTFSCVEVQRPARSAMARVSFARSMALDPASAASAKTAAPSRKAEP